MTIQEVQAAPSSRAGKKAKAIQSRMKQAVLGMCSLILISMAFADPDANGVLYVNQSVSGGDQSGDSWVNAIPELGTALDNASSLNDSTPGTVKQIWVAQGTYKPTTYAGPAYDEGSNPIPGTDRDKAFVLIKDVAIYGGFLGTESTTSSRTLPRESTILSGDLGTENDISDNCYHVVMFVGDVGSALLDRFAIVDGNADDFDRYVEVDGNDVSADEGGGLKIHNSSPHVSDVFFHDNEGGEGGGTCIHGGAPVFQHVAFFENGLQNSPNGGAIRGFSGQLTLTDAFICGNKGGYGGGIYLPDGPSVLTNVMITGNVTSRGGGIYMNSISGSAILTNVTISGNYTSSGAGIKVHSGSIQAHNCLVVGNTGDDTSENVTFRSSLAGETYYDAAGATSTPSNAAPADLFINPQDASAAPTTDGDYHLKYEAFAVDQGDNTWLNPGADPDLSGITADLDGKPRILKTAVDLGAFESFYPQLAANGIIYVNQAVPGGDHSGGSWTDATPELGAAMDVARLINDSTPGTVKQIWVAQGTYKPTTCAGPAYDFISNPIPSTDRDKAFVLLKDVSIYGGFLGTESTTSARTLPRESTILSGDLGTENDISDNCYHVVISDNDVGSALLDRFVIADGCADNPDRFVAIEFDDILAHKGGGLVINNSSPHVSDVLFQYNEGLEGGGVCLDGGVPVFQHVAFLENGTQTEPNGSAIDGFSGQLMLTDALICGNTAFDGGGIYLPEGPSVLTNVLITGNTSSDDGGGIFMDSGSPSSTTLTNVTVSGNYTVGECGGIDASGGTIEVHNSLVLGNIGSTSYDYMGDVQFRSSLAEGAYFDASGASSTQPDTTADLFKDPQSASAAPTTDGDYHLKDASFAIDKGDNAWYTSGSDPDLSGITTDLDSHTRIQGGAVDLGAFEYGTAATGLSKWELD